MNWSELPATLPQYQILLTCEVGSGAHGIAKAGRDDEDVMGVCVEAMRDAFGLGSTFEQIIHRTAAVREGRHDAPSQPGDLDLTIYSLRKWCRLALDGNPTVLLLLWAPYQTINPEGMELRALADHFASRLAGKRFLGYLQAQRQRLLGERGQRNVNRRDLVERFGFDTKYAGHMLRLGYQGVEFMESGRLTLPMKEPERGRVLAVRAGEVLLNDVLNETGDVERRLKDLLDTSPLPPTPDREGVERWMVDIYREHWEKGPL